MKSRESLSRGSESFASIAGLHSSDHLRRAHGLRQARSNSEASRFRGLVRTLQISLVMGRDQDELTIEPKVGENPNHLDPVQLGQCLRPRPCLSALAFTCC